MEVIRWSYRLYHLENNVSVFYTVVEAANRHLATWMGRKEALHRGCPFDKPLREYVARADE
jgi:hypothetical protein